MKPLLARISTGPATQDFRGLQDFGCPDRRRTQSETGLSANRGRSTRRWLPWLLKLLVSISLLGLLLRSVEPTIFWETIRSADIRLLSVAVVLFFPGQLLAAYRWYFLLERLGRSLPFWSLTRYTMLGQLSTLFLPGRISGDVVRTIAVAHGQQGKTTFALSVIVDKIALLIAMATFALLGAWSSTLGSRFVAVYSAALGLLFAALPILLFLCRYRSDQIPHRLVRLSHQLSFARRYVLGLTEWLYLPRLSFRTIFLVLTLGFGLQLFHATGSYILARSMHIPVTPIDWAAIHAIVALIQILPLTIGGLGIRESLFAGMLSLYQVPVAQSTAFSLAGFVIVALLLLLSWFILESSSIHRQVESRGSNRR